MTNSNGDISFLAIDQKYDKKISSEQNKNPNIFPFNSNNSDNKDNDFGCFNISSSDESLSDTSIEFSDNNNMNDIFIPTFFIDSISEIAEKQIDEKVIPNYINKSYDYSTTIQNSQIKQAQSNSKLFESTPKTPIFDAKSNYCSQTIIDEKIYDFLKEGISQIEEIKQKTIETYEKMTKEEIKSIEEAKAEAIKIIEEVENDSLIKFHQEKNENLNEIKNQEINRIINAKNLVLNKIKNAKIEALTKIQNVKEESLRKINDVKIETLSKIENVNNSDDDFGIDSSDEFLSDTENDEKEFIVPKLIVDLIVEDAEHELNQTKKIH